MFKVPIDKIIPVTNARAQIASLVKNVNETKSLYVLTRGGKPAAILASIDYINRHSSVKEESHRGVPEKYHQAETLPEPEKPTPVEPTEFEPTGNVPAAPVEKDNEPLTVTGDDQNNGVSHSYDAEEPVKISIK